MYLYLIFLNHQISDCISVKSPGIVNAWIQTKENLKNKNYGLFINWVQRASNAQLPVLLFLAFFSVIHMQVIKFDKREKRLY